MVNAYYDKETNEVFVAFSGDNFQELIEIAKEHGWRYEPEEKMWYTSPHTAYPTFKYITKNIEDVHITSDDFASIKANRYAFGKKETNLTSIQVDPTFLTQFPPVKGKTPYENFQVECIERGLAQDKFAFFLGMGSGKTYIVIQVLNNLIQTRSLDKIIILAPPEGVVNWRRELIKFSPFIKREDIVISTARNNRNPLEFQDAKVVIMTYRHFLTVSDDYYKKNNPKGRSKKYRKPQIPFDSWGKNRALILDESHNIKNFKARQSHVIHLHKRYFKYRYLLTGTPSPNNFGELYSQMKLMDNSLVPPSYTEWIGMIADIGNRFSKYAINYFYEDELKRWEKSFASHVVRYRSDDILDLPELVVNKIYTEMSPIQRDIYRKLIEHVIFTVKENNNGELTPRLMLNKFPFISMALDNPMLLRGKIENPDLDRLIEKFRFRRDHGKFESLVSLIDQYIHAEKRKVVLFDFHPLTMNTLAEYFEEKKFNPLVIHGQNTPKGVDATDFRSNVLDTFKQSKRHNLLCASSRVLATAVNLQEATRGLYFSRDYSYLSWSQSQKRLHRLGQDQRVIINPFIFEESLDVRLDSALENKHDLDKSIFKKESLTLEEWRKIFTGDI
jgi:SNF2 family DNA or RNA helicase